MPQQRMVKRAELLMILTIKLQKDTPRTGSFAVWDNSVSVSYEESPFLSGKWAVHLAKSKSKISNKIQKANI